MACGDESCGRDGIVRDVKTELLHCGTSSSSQRNKPVFNVTSILCFVAALPEMIWWPLFPAGEVDLWEEIGSNCFYQSFFVDGFQALAVSQMSFSICSLKVEDRSFCSTCFTFYSNEIVVMRVAWKATNCWSLAQDVVHFSSWVVCVRTIGLM